MQKLLCYEASLQVVNCSLISSHCSPTVAFFLSCQLFPLNISDTLGYGLICYNPGLGFKVE